MEQPIEQMTRVDHRKLTRFVTAAFEKLGVPPGDAAIAAKALVAADLRGAILTASFASALTPGT
jgi:LDH2 family malate/lactate/ureidoglycolate dehydrogenase